MSEQIPVTQAEQPDVPPDVARKSTIGEPGKPANGSGIQIVIAAIAAVVVISLCCIISCTIILYAFFMNAPW